ncbi:MAG: hypothetical protein MK078_03285 [Crocinitomicaceae bacterium]|nr:hypothetical protein [Crocinitomicaceae bacterium]
MKAILILLGFFSINAFAGLFKSLPSYTIVSEKIDTSIPKGNSVVVGNVANWDGTVIPNALISTVDFTKQTTTDSLGNFRLPLSDQDSAIFFFYFGYSESILTHDFKSQHVLTVKFHAQENWEVITVDKPVIYCYSEDPISVNLKLGFKSDLTFTYPQYKEGWRFEVDQKGITAEGKEYPYLFWEGKTDELTYNVGLENEIEGYIVNTDTVVSFLENTLSAFGLNQNEKTDFITFWGPRMVGMEYALVQFQTNDLYAQNIASINCEPRPDAMFRLFMNFTPLTSEELPGITIVNPQIESFERSGFTLIEWGGSEIPVGSLILTNIN